MMLSMPSCAPTMEERANEAIKNVMNEFEVVGISAAVVKNGQIVYNESFGYANLEDKTPLTNEHIMRIASISKSFTNAVYSSTSACVSFTFTVVTTLISLPSYVCEFTVFSPFLKTISVNYIYVDYRQFLFFETKINKNIQKLRGCIFFCL